MTQFLILLSYHLGLRCYGHVKNSYVRLMLPVDAALVVLSYFAFGHSL